MCYSSWNMRIVTLENQSQVINKKKKNFTFFIKSLLKKVCTSKVLLYRNWRGPTNTQATSSSAWKRYRWQRTSRSLLRNGCLRKRIWSVIIQATRIALTSFYFSSERSFLLCKIFYTRHPWERCKRLRLAFKILGKSSPAYIRTPSVSLPLQCKSVTSFGALNPFIRGSLSSKTYENHFTIIKS